MMKRTLLVAAVALVFVQCKKEDKDPQPSPNNGYNTGVLVTNEGPFQSGAGSVSIYDRSAKTIENNVFQNANGIPVGAVLQSAAQINGNVYLVLNKTAEIVVADAKTMKQKATISGLSSPRFMLPISTEKAYVTDWVSNEVAVVNLVNNTIEKRISVNEGPERMERLGNLVFVANSGGFGKDSTVSIINVANDQVEGEIVVGTNPNSLQADVNGNLWVLCNGFSDWQDPTNDIAGALYQIDATTQQVAQVLDFPSTNDHPGSLAINEAGTVLYFLNSSYAGNVYAMNLSSTNLPTSPLISGAFYALGVDESNNEIYVADPLDYNQSGIVYRYNSSGVMLDSVKAGLIPGNFLFR